MYNTARKILVTTIEIITVGKSKKHIVAKHMIMTIKVFVRLLDKTTGTTKGYYLMDNLGAMR